MREESSFRNDKNNQDKSLLVDDEEDED